MGWGPFPRLGVAGTATANLIGFGRRARVDRYLASPWSPVRLTFKGLEIRREFFLGNPARGRPRLGQHLLTNLTVVLITGLVGPFGTLALAGYGMGRGSSIADPPRLRHGHRARRHGRDQCRRGQIARAERVAWTGAGIAAGVTASIGLLAAAFPRLWLGSSRQTRRRSGRSHVSPHRRAVLRILRPRSRPVLRLAGRRASRLASDRWLSAADRGGGGWLARRLTGWAGACPNIRRHGGGPSWSSESRWLPPSKRARGDRRHGVPKPLDMLRKVQRGELPPPPVATLIGFTIGSIEPGRVVMEMEVRPTALEPIGHGARRYPLRPGRRRHGHGLRLVPRRGRDLHHPRAQDQLPQARLSGRLTATGYVVKSGRSVRTGRLHRHRDSPVAVRADSGAPSASALVTSMTQSPHAAAVDQSYAATALHDVTGGGEPAGPDGLEEVDLELEGGEGLVLVRGTRRRPCPCGVGQVAEDTAVHRAQMGSKCWWPTSISMTTRPGSIEPMVKPMRWPRAGEAIRRAEPSGACRGAWAHRVLLSPRARFDGGANFVIRRP